MGRQPCWWGGERPVSKSGEALLATGGALLEDPLGLYYYYYTVPCHLLIQKIPNTNMHPIFKKWLANFLSGRLA